MMWVFAKNLGAVTLVALMSCTLVTGVRNYCRPPPARVEYTRDWRAENERDAAKAELASSEKRHAEHAAGLERQLAVAQANERAFKVACEFYQRHAILPPLQAGEPGRLPRMNLPTEPVQPSGGKP